MTLLFAVFVLVGFVAKLISSLGTPRLPEWVAWALWLVAAVVWFLERLV